MARKNPARVIIGMLCEVFSPADILSMCDNTDMVKGDKGFIDQYFIKEWSKERCDMPVREQDRKVARFANWLVTEAIKRKPEMTEYQKSLLEKRLTEMKEL